jgi:hypothetical protein
VRHRFHSLCPYFAMFPEQFVRKHLIWSRPGDLVLDPFSGRGTTVFESLLNNRAAIGGDTNPVAVCVSRAKADPPRIGSVLRRISDLERRFATEGVPIRTTPRSEFFRLCFHSATLRQIVFLRSTLDWRRSRIDCFLAALMLGALHGESHRSAWCLSNRMPRTISTKPAYSVRWWRQNGSVAPRRDAFAILRSLALFRYESIPPTRRGRVGLVDARKIASRFPDATRSVGLVITSPPYLDTTNYREDQWLRLWFLGGPESPVHGVVSDDRHRTTAGYWQFLKEAWSGMSPLLRDGAHVVVRIGGRGLRPDEAKQSLLTSLREGCGTAVRLVSHDVSSIREGQLRAFRPGAVGTQVEHDFHFRLA